MVFYDFASLIIKFKTNKECGYATKQVAALSLHPLIRRSYDPMILNDFNTILNDFFKIIDFDSNSSNNIIYINDFNDFNELMKTINERRAEVGLTSIFNVSSCVLPASALKSLKSCKNTHQITSVVHDFKNKDSNHLKSIKIIKPKKSAKDASEPSQHDRITEIKNYCINKEFVSITALNSNFNPSDIFHLIKSGLLVRVPSEAGFENYKWIWF